MSARPKSSQRLILLIIAVISLLTAQLLHATHEHDEAPEQMGECQLCHQAGKLDGPVPPAIPTLQRTGSPAILPDPRIDIPATNPLYAHRARSPPSL